LVDAADVLAESTLEQIAARSCCDDRTLTVWDASGRVQYQPAFVLNPHSSSVEVQVLRGEGLSGIIATRLVEARELEGDGMPLPNGRLLFAGVRNGLLVAGDEGEWGGGLVFLSEDGRQENLVSGRRVADVHGIDERTAIALVADGRELVPTCFEVSGEAKWHATHKFDIDGAAVGGDAAGEAVVASPLGEIFAVSCRGRSKKLASVPLVELNRLRPRRTELGPCVSPPLVPTSVRRYRDHLIGLTIRNATIVLEPFEHGGYSTQWFGRRAECSDAPTPQDRYP
jgi:hypothetical protein